MAAKWSPARGAVRSEPFPLLRSVVRNGPERSRARRCWARRSEPLTARTVLRGSLKRERRGERLAKSGPPFWYPRPPPLTVFGVVREKPIGATRDGGQQHRNVCPVTNQMACGLDLRLAWIGHDLRLHERNQSGIVRYYPASLAGFKPAQADQKVVFNLLTHRFGENEPTNPGCAQREDSFVQSPGRHYTGGQHVRVEEKPDAFPLTHRPLLRRVSPRSCPANSG